jgi:hypothetical protein
MGITGELANYEICKDCPIKNPKIGHCWECNRYKLGYNENE